MKRRAKKRALAILLVLTAVFMLLPTAAFATDEESGEPEYYCGKTASDGHTHTEECKIKPEEAKCSCDSKCTEESKNAECAICGADITACTGLTEEQRAAQERQVAINALKADIAALPAASALGEKTDADKADVLSKINDISDRIEALALTEDEQTTLGMAKLEALSKALREPEKVDEQGITTNALIYGYLYNADLPEPISGTEFVTNKAIDNNTWKKIKPANEGSFDDALWNTGDGTGQIDLWVYSEDMTADGKNNGSCVPYVKDGSGNTLYLTEIKWFNYYDKYFYNNTTGNYEDIVKNGTILTTQNIADAAASSNKSAYLFNISGITVQTCDETDPCYLIAYYWSTTDPTSTTPVTPKSEYSVKYELGLSGWNLYPVQYGTFSLTDGGISASDAVSGLQTKVNENARFTVGTGLNGSETAKYTDFLAWKDVDGTRQYKAFKGWKDKSGAVHAVGDSVEATSSLAGDDNTITLTGEWEDITPLTEAELENLKSTVKIDALVSPEGEKFLVKQETNETPWTADRVTLDADGNICYKISAKVAKRLVATAGDFDGRVINNFASFDLSMSFDSKLVFACEGDTVSFTLTSYCFKPITLSADGEPVSADVQSTDNTYTITVNKSDIMNEDGSIKPVSVHVEWNPAKYTPNEVNQDSMVLSAPAMKLKSGESIVEAYKNGEIATNGNITGSIRLAETGMNRYRYQTVQVYLENEQTWQTAFGSKTSPVALAHAVQFMDWNLSNITLDGNSSLTANTVYANYPTAEYTVRHEYYTNGALDGSEDGSDKFSGYVGDVIKEADVSDTEKPEQETFGDEGAVYTYAHDEDNQITLVKDSAENVIVLRYERSVGGLKVSKSVKGEGAPTDAEFAFTVTLGDKSISGAYGDMTFTDGTATFRLKNSESKTASGLPAGTKYSVAEESAKNYTASSTGESGTIEANKTAGAVFTNTYVTVEVTVNKVWSDNSNKQGARPGYVTMQLYKDGEALGDAVTIDTSDGWTYTWSGLDADGEYTVKETNIPKGYYALTKQRGNVVTITNCYGVKTGDESNLALWLTLAGVSLAGAAAAVIITRKKRGTAK